MRADQPITGRTVKTVLVSEIRDESDEQIVDCAIRAARETRPSLFGWHVSRALDDSHRAVVSLYTD